MRKYWLRSFLLAVAVFISSLLWSQVGNNLTLLSNWDNNNLPINYNLVYNEVFGWAGPMGREYAILGSHQRTYFIEVTNPAAPIVRDSVEGTYPIAIHRDFKTYGHYCYGVADEGNSTLQIIDMSYLPDSVHVVYNSASFFERAHNIFIDTTRGRLYVAGSNTQNSGVIILNIASNPTNPTLLASVNLGNYSHDLSVRNDTAYMNNGFDGLKIVDFSIPTAPVTLAVLPSYPQQGYNHSCWLTEDGKYLAMCDETRNKSCKMVDVRNLGNVNVASLFRSALLAPADTGSIPHNPLVTGQYACVAYYHDGVQIFDIANPAAPVHVAGYDTWPNNTNYNDWYGAWGCYPFLPSGTVLGSDVHNGLFAFRVPFPFPRPITAVTATSSATCSYTANGSASITAHGGTFPYTYLWSSGQTTPSITAQLPGTYTVTISDRYGYNIVQTMTIAGPAPIDGNPQVAAETCPGNADGEIDLHTTGGTPGYTYLWSTGDLIEDLNGLTAAQYSVTITDSLGCVQIDTFTVSSIFTSPIADAGNDTVLCNNALLAQAQAPLQGTGHWQWISGGGLIQNVNLPNSLISNLQSGANLVAWIVYDGQCATADTVRIWVSSTAFVEAGPDTLICGTSMQLQGSSPGNGSGLWVAQPNSVSFTNPNDPAASVGGLQPGIYTLFWSVTEGNCQAVDSLEVLVNVQPFAAFSYTIAGLTVSFNNVSQFATSWHWDFGDGNTSALQNPSHTYTNSGVYNVCLTATDTCGSDASCQAINISLLGSTAVQPSTVGVWPNPFHDDLWIADRGIQVEPMQYEIYDASGRSMLYGRFESGSGSHRLALSGLAPGLYLISIRLGERQWMHKILKN